MKSYISLIVFIACSSLSAISFTACDDDDDPTEQEATNAPYRWKIDASFKWEGESAEQRDAIAATFTCQGKEQSLNWSDSFAAVSTDIMDFEAPETITFSFTAKDDYTPDEDGLNLKWSFEFTATSYDAEDNVLSKAESGDSYEAKISKDKVADALAKLLPMSTSYVITPSASGALDYKME